MKLLHSHFLTHISKIKYLKIDVPSLQKMAELKIQPCNVLQMVFASRKFI